MDLGGVGRIGEPSQGELVRLVQKGWISAEWGESENHRKAKFYSITKAGRKQLAVEARDWERVAGTIGRMLEMEKR
jgi:DNA-binding PadR family transcriptional regulator